MLLQSMFTAGSGPSVEWNRAPTHSPHAAPSGAGALRPSRLHFRAEARRLPSDRVPANGESKLVSHNQRNLGFESLKKAPAKLPVQTAILDVSPRGRRARIFSHARSASTGSAHHRLDDPVRDILRVAERVLSENGEGNFRAGKGMTAGVFGLAGAGGSILSSRRRGAGYWQELFRKLR